jgi:signal transduction histidine kinase
MTEYTNHIKQAGERGAKLTKKLLTFSRQKSSEDKVVNLNTLLEDSKLMLEKTLTVRINLVFELEKHLWSIYIDEGDLGDAILNMGINAMHAIQDNGTITFETRNEAIKEIDAQNLQVPPGDYVLLGITDTGCGMNNETTENIFDPFFSTKGELGTGLGLSQVYGLTQRSKGNIKIYSELGHGSRFTLYFPRHHESDTEDKQVKEVGEVKRVNLLGNQIILVVDDEVALTELTSVILTEQRI